MEHMQQGLVRDRQLSMLGAAAAERDAQRAMVYSRIVRRAERAERQQLSHRIHAARLRAQLERIEAIG